VKNWLMNSGLTVFTPFGGKTYCLEAWFRRLKHVSWPEKTRFLWAVSNKDFYLFQKLKKLATELPFEVVIKKSTANCYFQGVTRDFFYKQSFLLRNSVVVGIYNEFLQHPESYLLLIYEDDIFPQNPQWALDLLLDTFSKNPAGTIAVGGVIPSDDGQYVYGPTRVLKTDGKKYVRKPIKFSE
ncbi:MAG: hypothetical protein RMI91_15445, partial [Gemmatales bacterium]|nr:hypothetical protein [Gemmatales bacterium]